MQHWPKEIKKESKALYIPSTGVGFVYICPGAKSLAEVNPANAEIWLTIGETEGGMTMTTTTYDGQDYYVVSGIKGSGGGEGDFIADHVVISEVYVNPVNESESMWIELYNPADSNIDLGGWSINTSSGYSWANATIPPGEVIPHYGFFLIADGGFSIGKDVSSWPHADFEEEIDIINENGWIQLKNLTETVIDTVGWGSATVNETSVYPTNPLEGKSLQRKVNATITEDGYGPAWDSDNNSADFFVRDSPNPQNSNFGPLPPIPELPSLILLVLGMTVLATCIVVSRKTRRGLRN